MNMAYGLLLTYPMGYAGTSLVREGDAVKKALPWIIVGLVVVGIAVFALKPATAGVQSVDVQGVQDAQAKGVRVVDVRSPGEFTSGHIPGAQNVTLDQFQSVASQWDKSAPVVVYCQTGARSAEAVAMMQQLGFKSILHFDKGIIAWTGSLEQGGGSTSEAPPLQASALPVMYEFYTGW